MDPVRLLTRAAAVGLVVAGCGGEPDREATTAEIRWDTWGVPHVTAGNDEDLMRGFAWAQMRAHGDVLLWLYGLARGRGAEYWGEAFLHLDAWVLENGVPERARAWYGAQPADFRRLLDAFAAGINAVGEVHADRLDDEHLQVLPVDAVDVIAHAQSVMVFDFLVSPGAVDVERRRLDGGSNAWAIGPSRSASGDAMLRINPHVVWTPRHQMFEAHLSAPGGELYGATLVGFPVLIFGFRDELGWTHTVNPVDGADLYELELEPDSDRYRFDGDWAELEVDRRTVRVRERSGDLEERELEIRRSVHGPLVAEHGDRALALRVAGLDRAGALEQWWRMGRARDLAEFEAALAMHQLPLLSVLYADRDGHILHHFGGFTPVRPPGVDDWTGAVDGTTSTTLWSEVHPVHALPRVVDPSSGWLQNANDPPWHTTLPAALDPADFPADLAPPSLHPRAQRSARLLRDDDSITFEELVEYHRDTRVELADRLLDDLVPAARAAGGEAAEAADVLEAWDRRADPGSRGTALFFAFLEELFEAAGAEEVLAVPWDPARPLDTPDGFARPERAAALLATAAKRLRTRHGALDVPWSEVFRVEYDAETVLPIAGAPDSLGTLRVFELAGGGPSPRYVQYGDAFAAVVRFGETVEARAVMSYGNASEDEPDEVRGQLAMALEGGLREVLLEEVQIEASAVLREQVPGDVVGGP